MIQISQNTNNLVTLDLTSNSSYWNFSAITPFYLFSFTSDTTQQVINFVADNIAPISARTRYDQFNIIETGSTYTNLTGGTISLANGTFWSYSVYEQYPDQYNLNPANALNIVSTGRIYYTLNFNNGYIYYSGNSSNQYLYYTPYN